MTPTEYLDALLSLPGLWSAEPSPDGRWVAWTWFRVGPAADVFVAPTDGSTPPIRLTETADNTIVVNWTLDSRAVIVAQDKDGNERAQLFRVDIERPLVMLPLTEPEPNYYVRGGQLHPNGRWLIYGANVDAETGREIEPTWVYRHDLVTGERRPLARPLKGHYYQPDLSPTGEHTLYARKDLHPAGRQIWLVDIEGQHDREIVNVGADMKAFASWFPDGRRVLVQGETPTHRRLGVWELATGELRWLLDDPQRNVESAHVPFGSQYVVVVEMRQAQVYAYLLDPYHKPPACSSPQSSGLPYTAQSGAEIAMPDLPGNLRPLAPTPDGHWVGQYLSSRQPTDLVRFPIPIQQLSYVSLTRVWERTPLTPADLTPAEPFRWQSVDGLEIHGWLYRPAGPAQGAIVYVHGGPTAVSLDMINNQIQFFVRYGFNVLDPNYRGSVGYSLAFREAIKQDGWGGREQADIRAGIEALIAAGIARPGQVGITGTSYGGYSAWWAITHFPPEIVAASAPICGMTDLVVDYETTRPDLRPYSEEMMGGRPDQVPERYRERSPLYSVPNIRGKLLIVQGLQDPNVTPENVRAVRTALEEANVPYEILTFDDEGHGISRPKNQKVLYQRLLDFFQRAFGPG